MRELEERRAPRWVKLVLSARSELLLATGFFVGVILRDVLVGVLLFALGAIFFAIRGYLNTGDRALPPAVPPRRYTQSTGGADNLAELYGRMREAADALQAKATELFGMAERFEGLTKNTPAWYSGTRAREWRRELLLRLLQSCEGYWRSWEVG